MKESEKWDRLLGQALAPNAEPEEHLNQSLIMKIKERKAMKRRMKKGFKTGLLVASVAVVMSVTAYAATYLFTPKQVAEQLGDQTLAVAFDRGDAIEINESISSGEYQFTLHGIVSGEGLSEFSSDAPDISPERTYTVVSIARQDGSPMPATSDPSYGQDPIFVSPFIKGLKPWQVNIATMSGSYSEFVADGIMYRLLESDTVEMFADRGVYLAVASGTSFYSNEAFAFDERTGEISARSEYEGAVAVFDLPLNVAKADPAKAEKYLEQQQLLDSSESRPKSDIETAEEQALNEKMAALKAKIPHGTVLPESVKQVTIDEHGNFHYEYDGWSVELSQDLLFADNQTGYSDAVQYSESETYTHALLFHRDADGVITGKIVELE